MANQTNSANLSFENQLRRAADALRANMDAAPEPLSSPEGGRKNSREISYVN